MGQTSEPGDRAGQQESVDTRRTWLHEAAPRSVHIYLPAQPLDAAEQWHPVGTQAWPVPATCRHAGIRPATAMSGAVRAQYNVVEVDWTYWFRTTFKRDRVIDRN